MLEKLINSPKCSKYMASFEKGETIFFEGDDTRDLYILVSGDVELLKGTKTISEVKKPGDLFGEMSVLLGGKRSATAKALSNVKALKIVDDEIPAFFGSSPEIARDITRMLAKRLDETSQILYGLSEFSDQLPDAVAVTDHDEKILTWNSVAEKMYGRSWHEMHYRPISSIYEDPEEYTQYLSEVKSNFSVREKILKIKHPENGIRYISTSTKVLYDGHHNYQGLLSIGRDVTDFRETEIKYEKIRKKIIPVVILFFLAVASAFTVYQFSGRNTGSVRESSIRDLRAQLGKDYVLIKSMLMDHFESADRDITHRFLEEFISIQDAGDMPYNGIVLLDRNMKVFDYISAGETGSNVPQMIGSSYSGIEFKGSDRSLHKVLTLYRKDDKHPMGKKGVEVAFECANNDVIAGWVVFQLNPEVLKEKYGIDEADDLLKFKFKRE